MLRVITGSAKNRKLKTPKIKGFQAVQEVAKAAVFSMLADKVTNSECLDLFAGSGNLGIEALSRGAEWCDFVDEKRKSVEIIKENLAKCDLQDRAKVYQDEAVKFVGNIPKSYDIIFIDPFYKDVKHKFLMEMIQEILNEESIIIFFHGENLEIDTLIKKTQLEIIESRRYGKSYVDFLIKVDKQE